MEAVLFGAPGFATKKQADSPCFCLVLSNAKEGAPQLKAGCDIHVYYMYIHGYYMYTCIYTYIDMYIYPCLAVLTAPS